MQQGQSCERKSLQEILLGQGLLHKLELHFSSSPQPSSLPKLPCSSAQFFCQSLTPSLVSELPQYYSPAWQSQGWGSPWSPSPALLALSASCGMRSGGYGSHPGLPYPPPPWVPQPFQSSPLLLPAGIFSPHFMQPEQQIKEIILAQSNNIEEAA